MKGTISNSDLHHLHVVISESFIAIKVDKVLTSSSRKRRINSGIAMVGCVSLSCTATLLSNAERASPDFL